VKHKAEMAIHQYMSDAANGKSSISEDTIKQVGKDVMDAMQRQFGGGNKRDEFRLRMSNIGRPSCQLWFEKHKPEKALPKPTTFLMNMMLGDIVEAVFKGVLKEAGVHYEDSEQVTLDLGEDHINGTYDLVVDGAVDDIKSASDWSYRNKFDSYDTLNSGDSFGYVAQLAGYAKAANKKAGGWWVVNKANGDFKYVPADNINVDDEIKKIKKTVDTVNKDVFSRCFEPEEEYFRGKPTGNTVLNSGCRFCSYRETCWDLTERPAVKSQAKTPKMVSYITMSEEYA
jgi:hypothetical protein|tara:strand:- start:2217 stop:3071 length:855 start_codon:yes stop_codon:yes gene_type:complete